MKALGVVPAAGLGKRWGGYPKFLLPCADREWLLDRTIRQIPADRVAVMYSKETGIELRRHVARCSLTSRVIFLQNNHMEWDIWGSMYAALQLEAGYYYFVMPDTFPDLSVFSLFPSDGISLGLHQTDTPQRFGMLRNGMIINKQMGEPGLAWGILGWSREVRDLWLAAHLETYTDAINLAMQECGWHGVKMEYYFDMANFDSYVRFLRDFK